HILQSSKVSLHSLLFSPIDQSFHHLSFFFKQTLLCFHRFRDMNTQDHSKTGDEGHGPHICHRCGWPFPNSHPSPKHRRAHKRICGTIEGYTKLIESEAISDDEHHSDEDKDKDKTPSPKIEKGIIKESGNSAGGTEDDSFSDAMTEFSDSGISPVATKLLDSPIEVSKADDNLEVFKTPDTHTKDADETEENDINTVCNSVDTQIKLLDSDMKPSDPLIEDRDGSCKDKLMDLVEISNTVEMKPDSANAMDVSSKNVVIFEVSDKDQEEPVVYVLSVPSDIPLVDHSETLIDDFKDHETIYSNVPMVLDHDTFEVKTEEHKIQESQASETGEFSIDESIVSEHPNTGSILVPTDVTEEVKESETKPLEMSKTVPEAKVSLGERTETASKEINQEKLEFDHEHAPEVVKNTEIDHGDPVLTEEDPASERPSEAYTQEFVKEPESGFEAEQKIMGSVGVDSKEMLSTASVDVENAHSIGKSEIVADKSRLGKSEGFQGQSLVELKEEISSETQNSEPPKSEAKIVNESEGRKRNEEAIAKVTNWSTGENSTSTTTMTTPLKNLAKYSNPTELSKNVIRKDEVVEKSREAEKSNLTSETPSPPKYIGDGKKVRKKGKGRGSWIPFGCCSSVNVN
ncbi:Zinc finger, C2H2, partial [Cynara cardunculus var. scolymus]